MGNHCLLLQVTEIFGLLLYSRPTDAGHRTVSEIPFAVLLKGDNTHTNINLSLLKKTITFDNSIAKILAYMTNEMKRIFPC